MSAMNRGEASPESTANPDVAREALGRFRVIFRSVREHFQEVERRCGISGSQLWLLAVVARQPGIRVTELARQLLMHQSTVSNLIEALSRRDLIVRRRSEHDRRVVLLEVGPLAHELLAKAPRPVEGLLPDALSHLSAPETEALIVALDSVLRVMQRRRKSGRLVHLGDS